MSPVSPKIPGPPSTPYIAALPAPGAPNPAPAWCPRVFLTTAGGGQGAGKVSGFEVHFPQLQLSQNTQSGQPEGADVEMVIW